MRYTFTPAGRIAPTTIVTPNQRVKLLVGNNEMDDKVWEQVKDDPTIAEMLENETLRVFGDTPPIKPETVKVKAPKES